MSWTTWQNESLNVCTRLPCFLHVQNGAWTSLSADPSSPPVTSTHCQVSSSDYPLYSVLVSVFQFLHLNGPVMSCRWSFLVCFASSLRHDPFAAPLVSSSPSTSLCAFLTVSRSPRRQGHRMQRATGKIRKMQNCEDPKRSKRSKRQHETKEIYGEEFLNQEVVHEFRVLAWFGFCFALTFLHVLKILKSLHIFTLFRCVETQSSPDLARSRQATAKSGWSILSAGIAMSLHLCQRSNKKVIHS